MRTSFPLPAAPAVERIVLRSNLPQRHVRSAQPTSPRPVSRPAVKRFLETLVRSLSAWTV
jgi:hypothetical protein